MKQRLLQATALAVLCLLGFVGGQVSAVADPGVPQPAAGAPPSPPPGAGAGKVPTPAPGSSPAPVTGAPAGGGNPGRPAPPPFGGLIQPATPSDPNATGIFDIPGEVKDAIASFFAGLLQPFVVPVMNLLAHLMLSTPDVTQLPRVAGLWDGLRLVACSLYVLAVLAAGILAMGHGTVQQRWSARDLIPRLVLGMLAANLSLTVCHQVIGLVNVVSGAVFGDGITADDLAGTLTGMLLNGNPTTGPLYLVVFALAVTVIAVAVVATVLVRIACVLVLVVSAPLLLACHGSPATEGAARLWWKAFFGIMGIQVLQSIVFLVTVKVLLDPGNYNFLGAPTAGALINLTVLGGCLYLLVKIPGWIRHLVTNPVQRTVGGRGGLHLLQKVALGALGIPFGPYALGAQIAGRFGSPGAAQGMFGMPGRGPRRPPGTPGGPKPRRPKPPDPPGGPGRPKPPGPGGAPGGGGPGHPSGGRGSGPGGRPSGPAGGPVPAGSGPGVPTYQWGTPRRNGPPRPGGTGGPSPRRQPAAPATPIKPALPHGGGGGQTPPPSAFTPVAPAPAPRPGGGSPGPGTPRPLAAPQPRPALPPPLPRPALPAPPLPGGPKPARRQRKRP